MVVQIQVRRDTAANWTSNDPTLAEGEMGLETDTTFFKFGDGATAWTSLPYAQDALGLPAGGTTGQRLAKASNADYDTEWVTAAGATIDLTGDTGSASSIGDVTFAGSGGIAVDVNDDGGGAATVTIDGSGVSGGGGGSGALVFLEAHTASSSATLNFTSFISSTYDSYLFDFVNVLPATSGGVFFMRMGTGAGPTWDTGAGNHGSTDWRWVPGGAAQSGGTATAIVLTNYSAIDKVVNTANLGGVNGFARLADPQSSIYKNVTAQTSWYNTGGVIEGTSIHGIYLVTTVVTGVQFLFDNGNIASGIIRVYGITKS